MTAPLMVSGRFGAFGFDFRGTIVDGVVERLRLWLDQLYGGAVVAVTRFDDEVTATSDIDEAWKTLAGRAPAILVSAGRARYENQGSNRKTYKVDPLEIEVFFFSQHLRDQASRLAGDPSSIDAGGDPGIERMLADAQALLWGHEIGKFSGLVLDEEDRGPNAEGALVWQQTWITSGLIEIKKVGPLEQHPAASKIEATMKLVEQEGIE